MFFPRTCDGCGDDFSVQHTLDCKNGSLVQKGYNDVHDNDVQLTEAAWGCVMVKPIMAPEDDKIGHTLMQADWSVRDIWEGSWVAFFDNSIIYADAPSYLSSQLS